MDTITQENLEVLDETTKNNLALKAIYNVRKIGTNSVKPMSLSEMLVRINREGELSSMHNESVNNPNWQMYTIHNNWRAGLKHFAKMELVEIIVNEFAKPIQER